MVCSKRKTFMGKMREDFESHRLNETVRQGLEALGHGK